jgi:hypothetical protein
MTMPVHHFAILAPVPHKHLESGEPVAEATGYVAFGTAKWELFQKIEADRDGAAIPVLIYPSDNDAAVSTSLMVSWWGWYIGHTQSKAGAHIDGMVHRPPSTAKYPADNTGHWPIFWHVKGVRRLAQEKQLPISKVPTIKGGWRKNAPPRGPELVALPEALSYEA